MDRRVLVLAGPPGTGKSTLADMVAARVRHGVVIDKDAVCGPLVSAALTAAGQPYDLDSTYYKRWLSPAAYLAAEAMAARVLQPGVVPILVAPYERALDQPDWHDGLRQRLGATSIHVVWMTASLDVTRARLAQRATARDRSKLADWGRYATTHRPTGPPAWPHQAVETTEMTVEDLELVAAEIADRFGTG